MIAFGTIVSDSDGYRRFAEPTIRATAEPDSALYVLAPAGGMARSYNLLLDTAAGRQDIEALVIAHPFTEIADPGFCEKVRAALTDPDVAVVGAAGACRPPSLAWWEGQVRSPAVTLRYHEHGGGEIPAFSWKDPDPRPGDVDVVDGFLMAISPWGVRNLRFDESLVRGYGSEVDFCLQARAAGRKVTVAVIQAVFNRSLEPTDEWDLWMEAHAQLAEKWEGTMLPAPPPGQDWKTRARRAEAEHEAYRAFAYSNLLGSDARVLDLERDIERMWGTASWRVTEPLRRLNAYRGALGERLRSRRRQAEASRPATVSPPAPAESPASRSPTPRGRFEPPPAPATTARPR